MIAAMAATHSAWALTANFTSAEADRSVFYCGFDSEDELTGWTMNAWCLESDVQIDQADIKPFSSINPASTTSACCWDMYREQDEAMTSPLIEVPDGAKLRFYAAFSEYFGIWGHLEVSVIDGADRHLLLNSFLWSQDEGEGNRWVPFTYDLSAYAGKDVQLEFRFLNTASGGCNVYVDDVEVVVPDTSDSAKITVNEGDTVHFSDLSEGATAWSWSFAGGIPAESNEPNPEVVYNTGGVYDVTLAVSDAAGNTSRYTRTAYVNVVKQPVVAKMGMPEGTYMSPWTMCFAPLNTPLTFRDLSTGRPTEWVWTLPGTENVTYTEQNPTMSYREAGVYNLKLHASNEIGGSDDEYRDAFTAGGSQYIWNITPEESEGIEPIALGWYGNYGGSNWLGMQQFAEYFSGPAADASIDAVQAYFAKTTVVDASADVDITVSINAVDADGRPGEVLASASAKASELKDGSMTYEATDFVFATPAQIGKGQAFFVVIGPFPNNEDATTYQTDDIALYCSPRVDNPADRPNHMWHYLLDEGPNYEFLETGAWYAQEEEPGSLVVTPHMTFADVPDGIADTEVKTPKVRREGDMLYAEGALKVYNLSGILVACGTDSVNIATLASGTYIVTTTNGAVKISK